MDQRDRVVQTRVPTSGGLYMFGSGFVVAPCRILTAAHVLARKGSRPAIGEPCWVHPLERSPSQWLVGSIAWVDEVADAAVVEVPELAPEIEPATWGVLEGDKPLDWIATGFPLAGLEAEERVEEAVYGTVAPNTERSAERLGLNVTSREPGGAEGQDGWGGLSGAAVLVDGAVVGVMLRVPARWQRSLRAVRITAFHESDEFLAALGLSRIHPEKIGQKTSSPALFSVPSPVHSVVGRDAEVRKLKEFLLGERKRVRAAITVLPGIGKSDLASWVAHEPDLRRHFPDGILWGNFGQFSDAVAEVGRWARRLGIEAEAVAAESTLSGRLDMLDEAIGNRHVLLIFDDVRDEDLARRLLRIGLGTSHLITTRDESLAAKLVAPQGVFRLNPLSLDASRRLLYEVAPSSLSAGITSEIDLLAKRTGGIPQALVLVGNQLELACKGGDKERCGHAAGELLENLARLKWESAEDDLDHDLTLAQVVEASLMMIDEESRAAFYRLCVFRPLPGGFTKRAAQVVANVPRNTVWDLSDAGFLVTKGGELYSIPAPYAEFGRRMLTNDEMKILNSSATAYYANERIELEESYRDRTSYERRLRYEGDEWVHLRTEWLYHLAQTNDRAAADVALARTYFEAHYWWGYYVDDPFCDELLALDPLGTSSAVVDLLRQFNATWPKVATSNEATDWRPSVTLLERCRKVLGVNQDVAVMSEDAIAIRLVTNLLLARALQGINWNNPQIEDLYKEAATLVGRVPDAVWIEPWVEYRLAVLAFRRGQPDEGIRRSTDSLEAALGQRDWELTSNNFALLAQRQSALGRHGKAAEAWSKAVFYAFWSQNLPEPPDFYNETFLEEVLGNCVNWLIETARQAGERNSMVNLLRAVSGIWCEEEVRNLMPQVDLHSGADLLLAGGDREGEDLRRMLFPPAPSQMGRSQRVEMKSYLGEVRSRLEQAS